MKFSEMPYTRVDFPAVIAQAQEIIQRASSAKSGEEQFEIHQEFNKLMPDLYNNLNAGLLYLNHDHLNPAFVETWMKI